MIVMLVVKPTQRDVIASAQRAMNMGVLMLNMGGGEREQPAQIRQKLGCRP